MPVHDGHEVAHVKIELGDDVGCFTAREAVKQPALIGADCHGQRRLMVVVRRTLRDPARARLAVAFQQFKEVNPLAGCCSGRIFSARSVTIVVFIFAPYEARCAYPDKVKFARALFCTCGFVTSWGMATIRRKMGHFK